MITTTDQILTRIESCLTLDPKDPTALRIQIDKIIHYLHEFRMLVPPKQYEELVKTFLTQRVLNKAELGNKQTFPAISKALLALADSLIEKAASQEIINIMTDQGSAIDKEIEQYLKNKKGE